MTEFGLYHSIYLVTVCVLHFVCQDTGPQMPSVVTGMLKFGSNLLQAVGQFNGELGCKSSWSKYCSFVVQYSSSSDCNVTTFRSLYHCGCLYAHHIIT